MLSLASASVGFSVMGAAPVGRQIQVQMATIGDTLASMEGPDMYWEEKGPLQDPPKEESDFKEFDKYDTFLKACADNGVDLGQFESSRMLVLEPPHGEFVLMNFHIGSLRHEGQIPFRVTPMLSAISEYKQELRLQIRAEFAEKYHGANVKVQFTVPKTSNGCSVELSPQAKGQTWEFDDGSKTVTWTIRKFVGGTVQHISCKFVTSGPNDNVRKEMGPISMSFEIPMYNVSQLQVQHLKIVERNKAYNPHRWVRCLTHAESYVCRV